MRSSALDRSGLQPAAGFPRTSNIMPALPPQQSPEQPSATPQQRLRELQAAVSSLQAAALDSQQQVAAAQAATADLGAQAVLVDAYCRRVQRLATLLQHYDAHLQAALAALGLAAPKQQQEVESGSPALAAADAAAALANGLRQVEEQLTVATLGATATPNPEALLQLGACAKSAAARAAAAGPAAILAQLQGALLADGSFGVRTCPDWVTTTPLVHSFLTSLPPPLTLQPVSRQTANQSTSGRRWRRLRPQSATQQQRLPSWALPLPGCTQIRRSGGRQQQRNGSSWRSYEPKWRQHGRC